MPIYSDLNEYHDKDNKDKKVKKHKVEDEESVYQSINNILTTIPGERLFNPEFGAQINDIVFELNDDETELILLDVILEAIQNFDSRIKLNVATSEVKRNIENNELELTLNFQIEGIDNQNFTHIGTIGV